MLDYNLCITLLSLLLCLLIFIRSLVLRKRIITNSQQLANLNLALQDLTDGQTFSGQKTLGDHDFQTLLQHADISTELHKSRISFSNVPKRIRVPERYAYARSMFCSGMEKDKIADALGMSSHEILQLSKLSTIASKTMALGQEHDTVSI